jgi:methylmalonyl-CoA mutase cobalamin-binding subunit
MAVQELMPTLRELSRSQKLEIIQFLAKELAVEEEMPLKQGGVYKIHTPFHSAEAAMKLATLLQEDE